MTPSPYSDNQNSTWLSHCHKNLNIKIRNATDELVERSYHSKSKQCYYKQPRNLLANT